MKAKLSIVILIAVWAFASIAGAADPERYVHIFGVRGTNARVMFAGEEIWKKAEKCMKLPEGSLIEAGPESKVYLRFFDKGEKVGLGLVKPMTRMKIEEFRREERIVKTRLKLEIGKVRVRVDKTTLEASFRVSTPNCIAGVVGTAFEVSYDDITNTSVIEVFDGSITIEITETGDVLEITGDSSGIGQRVTVYGDGSHSPIEDFLYDNGDPDHDGLSNLDEEFEATDPYNPDTDEDGVNDRLEVAFGSDPSDPEDTPQLPVMFYPGLVTLIALLGLVGIVFTIRRKENSK